MRPQAWRLPPVSAEEGAGRNLQGEGFGSGAAKKNNQAAQAIAQTRPTTLGTGLGGLGTGAVGGYGVGGNRRLLWEKKKAAVAPVIPVISPINQGQAATNQGGGLGGVDGGNKRRALLGVGLGSFAPQKNNQAAQAIAQGGLFATPINQGQAAANQGGAKKLLGAEGGFLAPKKNNQAAQAVAQDGLAGLLGGINQGQAATNQGA